MVPPLLLVPVPMALAAAAAAEDEDAEEGGGSQEAVRCWCLLASPILEKNLAMVRRRP